MTREPRESIAKKQRALQRFKEDLRERHAKDKTKVEEARVSRASSVDSEHKGKVDELRDMNVELYEQRLGLGANHMQSYMGNKDQKKDF